MEKITVQQLKMVGERALREGPNRVMISKREAVPWRRAAEAHITADIIFIRQDGWTLGAPSCYEVHAFALWPKEWMAYLRRPDTMLKPMNMYVPNEKGTV